VKRSGKFHKGRLAYPDEQKILSVQIKSQNNVPNFLNFRRIAHYVFLPTGKQSTKFTIWKYWKSCVKKLDGNDPKFFKQI
jgi:hypothetical protein